MDEKNPVQELHDKKRHCDFQAGFLGKIEKILWVAAVVLLVVSFWALPSSNWCFMSLLCMTLAIICGNNQKEAKQVFVDWCMTKRFDLLFSAWQAQTYAFFAPESEKENAIKTSDIASNTFQTFSEVLRGLKEGDDDAWGN